jgi:hypothetical protein
LFYEDFESMDAAATVSDHIPLEVVLDFVKWFFPTEKQFTVEVLI